MALVMAAAAKYGIDILGPLPDIPARAAAATPSAVMTPTQAAEQLRSQHIAAANAGDVESASSLFATDGVFMPPGQPAVEGAAAIRAWFTGVFGRVRLQDFNIQPSAVQTYGDALVERGTWKATFHPKDGSPSLPGGGGYVTVYARDADGSVRVTLDTFDGLPF